MKKTTTLKKISLFFIALFMITGVHAQIYVNGSFVNSPGTGMGGADESWLQDATLNMDLFGFNVNTGIYYRITDDFTVPVGQQWHLDSVYVYCYQTLAPITGSTIGMINIRILDDVTGTPGTTTVWGDTTTDQLLRSVWTNCYRVTESATGTNVQRPIYKNTVGTPGCVLSAGTYWLDFSITGSSTYSGPWANPLVIPGNSTSGNGFHVKGAANTYVSAIDDTTLTPQGFPFSLFGFNLLGINESQNISNVSLYPNPANDFVDVKIELAAMKPANIELANTLGEVVYSYNQPEQKQFTHRIDCSKLASGFYFMKIKVGTETITRKFTKK